MSIHDIPGPSALGVDVWRAVLHDAVDEVVDQVLLSARARWESECAEYHGFDDGLWPDDPDDPPGDPPGAPGGHQS